MTRHSRLALPCAAMAIPLLLLALALSAHAARPAAPARATMHVTIQNFAFSSQTITVPPGTTVIWTNKDSVAHIVTSDTGAWPDSGNLATGQTFSHAFTKAGNYPYHCAIHPSMTAKVIVASGGTTGGSITGGRVGSMGPMLYPAVARGVHDVEEPRQGRPRPGRRDLVLPVPGRPGPALRVRVPVPRVPAPGPVTTRSARPRPGWVPRLRRGPRARARRAGKAVPVLPAPPADPVRADAAPAGPRVPACPMAARVPAGSPVRVPAVPGRAR